MALSTRLPNETPEGHARIVFWKTMICIGWAARIHQHSRITPSRMYLRKRPALQLPERERVA